MQVVCVEHKIVIMDRGEEQVTKEHYVFITVGSTDFDALVQACDSLAPSLQGIIQIGHGQYTPVNMPYFRFAPSLAPYYEQASLVIAHGGLATVTEVLERGLALVGVSNPDRYDKHQEELLTALTEEDYLVWCRQLDDLACYWYRNGIACGA